MADWLTYSFLAIVFWGVVGLFQKLGTNRISARSLMVWLMTGFLILLPWFLHRAHMAALDSRDYLIGISAGVINSLGSWFLFASLEEGAKATVAVPLTALYPLITILLARGFLGETLTNPQWWGIGIALLAGVFLSHENK
jgi:bacterial/archaeal transporter family protein